MTNNTTPQIIYQIAWQSNTGSGIERGTYNTRKDAQHVCQEKNKRYPHIVHWVIAVDAETQTVLS